MDKRNNTFVERLAKNKRKFDHTSKNNQDQQQQQNKRQNTAGLTLQGLVIKNLTEVLNLYALNATITMMELALMCGRMFLKDSDKIEKYVGGLPDMIHRSVMTSNSKTTQDAVEFATELMDKKIRTFAERQTKNKRKFEDTSRNNKNQHQQNNRQNTGRAYTVGPEEKKPYGGYKPLCSKCNYQHDGLCAPKCHKCNRVGRLARNCRSPTNASTANNQRGTRAGQKASCFKCEA
nr:hypothetical protein [Tanacetum cinerariifolium]